MSPLAYLLCTAWKNNFHDFHVVQHFKEMTISLRNRLQSWKHEKIFPSNAQDFLGKGRPFFCIVIPSLKTRGPSNALQINLKFVLFEGWYLKDGCYCNISMKVFLRICPCLI